MKPFLLFLFFTLVLTWKDNVFTLLSQAIAKGGKLSDCWICQQRLQYIHDARDPLVLPVTNFSSILKVKANYNRTP